MPAPPRRNVVICAGTAITGCAVTPLMLKNAVGNVGLAIVVLARTEAKLEAATELGLTKRASMLAVARTDDEVGAADEVLAIVLDVVGGGGGGVDVVVGAGGKLGAAVD